MKNIEILIGSPRKRGNTHLMSEMLVDGLDKDKIVSNISFLYNLNIKPCIDCRACKKGKMICVLEDDMNDIYARLESSDVIIIATPIYWFGPSAKMKLLLDRFRPYYANKKLAGKQVALLLAAGAGAPDCDLTIEMFKRTAEALQLEYIMAVTAKAYDIGEVKSDHSARHSISELMAQINEAP